MGGCSTRPQEIITFNSVDEGKVENGDLGRGGYQHAVALEIRRSQRYQLGGLPCLIYSPIIPHHPSPMAITQLYHLHHCSLQGCCVCVHIGFLELFTNYILKEVSSFTRKRKMTKRIFEPLVISRKVFYYYCTVFPLLLFPPSCCSLGNAKSCMGEHA